MKEYPERYLCSHTHTICREYKDVRTHASHGVKEGARYHENCMIGNKSLRRIKYGCIDRCDIYVACLSCLSIWWACHHWRTRATQCRPCAIVCSYSHVYFAWRVRGLPRVAFDREKSDGTKRLVDLLCYSTVCLSTDFDFLRCLLATDAQCLIVFT